MIENKSLLYTTSHCNRKFDLIFILIVGCTSISQHSHTKTEGFQLVFNKDTVNTTFLVDSSLTKSESVIQWGCLKCFGYQSDEFELYFYFPEDQSDTISYHADSVITNYVKKRFIAWMPDGEITRVEKIANNKIYGLIEEYEHKEGRFYIFVGEFVSIHLSFSIEVLQNKANKRRPETLDDIINSLEIKVNSE